MARAGKQRTITGGLLTAWKSAAAAVVGRVMRQPAPARQGKDGGGFGLAARRITRRRRPRVPEAAIWFLSETLDWLNLWHPEAGETLDDPAAHCDRNHLSPRP